jgi:ornithine cyclodeaminase
MIIDTNLAPRGGLRSMPTLSADDVARFTPFDLLIEALRDAFAQIGHMPQRYHVEIPHEHGSNTLLLMPAWNGRYQGIKVSTIAPRNEQFALPSISSTFLLSDRITGTPLAILDGSTLTSRRTAATSALAASYLARTDSTNMLLIGTGKVASLLPHAYRTVLPIRSVQIHSRSMERAKALADELRASGFEASVCHDVKGAAAASDVISCATLANAIVLRGAWLKAGQFIDLVGSFKPESREADDDVFRDANIVIDTMAARQESGDLLEPIRNGVIRKEGPIATLASVCQGTSSGRKTTSETWIFKSVGTALQDIVAATLAYETVTQTTNNLSNS